MPATEESRDLAIVAARAAANKKATNIVALDVSERLPLTDAFVLATGANERQVQAIVQEIQLQLRNAGVKQQREEGYAEARWVLLDFGDIVVHVQHADEREFYALERLWHDCPIIALPEDITQLSRENALEDSSDY